MSDGIRDAEGRRANWMEVSGPDGDPISIPGPPPEDPADAPVYDEYERLLNYCRNLLPEWGIHSVYEVVDRLKRERDEAVNERNDLQANFDLRWKCDMRAIKMWQKAHPGNDLVWPDHANLCVWLMEQLEDHPTTKPVPSEKQVSKKQMSTDKPELIISADVETLGRVPGLNPLLSIGAAALSWQGQIVDTFEVNLELVPDLAIDPETERWWKAPGREEAWIRTRQNTVSPLIGTLRFRLWLEELAVRYDIVLLAKPAAFDMGFVQYYLHRFTGGSPFERFRSYDLHTMMSDLTGVPVKQVQLHHLDVELCNGEQQFQLRIKAPRGIEHVGIDDAIYQGRVAVEVKKALDEMRNQ